MVRRGFLIVMAGVSWCVGVTLLWTYAGYDYRAVLPVSVNGVHMSMSELQLPYTISGTPLTVVTLASYEGLYLEDGSCEEVSGIAAAVLRNESPYCLESGMVDIYCGGEKLRFVVLYLPPYSSVLALDVNHKPYLTGSVTQCSGEVLYSGSDVAKPVQIHQEGYNTLYIKNISQEPLYDLTVYFKNYDLESNMYLGGIAYEININQLAPGETTIQRPWYYMADESHIVNVRISG